MTLSRESPLSITAHTVTSEPLPATATWVPLPPSAMMRTGPDRTARLTKRLFNRLFKPSRSKSDRTQILPLLSPSIRCERSGVNVPVVIRARRTHPPISVVLLPTSSTSNITKVPRSVGYTAVAPSHEKIGWLRAATSGRERLCPVASRLSCQPPPLTRYARTLAIARKHRQSVGINPHNGLSQTSS